MSLTLLTLLSLLSLLSENVNGQHRGKDLYEVVAFLDMRGSGTSQESYLVPKEDATWERKAAIPRETRTTQLAKYLQNAKITGQVTS